MPHHAIAWAAVFVAVSDSVTTGVTVGAAVLVVLYPLIDVVASLIDARSHHGSARQLLLADAAVSAVAAVALGVAAPGSVADVLRVFGVWAFITGAAQLVVALRRRGSSATSGRCCSPAACPSSPASPTSCWRPATIRSWTCSRSTRPPAGWTSSSRPGCSRGAVAA